MKVKSKVCPAKLSIEGAHFPCDLTPPHRGLAHSNKDAGAIWVGDEGAR